MKCKLGVLLALLFSLSLLTFAATRSLAQGPEGGATPQGEAAIQAALGTAFTYQGRLTDGGNPANGTYDFQFKLFDADSDGTQVGSTVTVDDETVTDGLFTVQLDFGSDAFDGNARWLEIGVRPGSSTGGYTTLSPRQALTAVPYAISLVPGADIEREALTVNFSVANGRPGGIWPVTKKAIEAWTSDGTALWAAAGSGTAVYGYSESGTAANFATNSTTSVPTLRLRETQADYARLEFSNTTNTARRWHIAGLIAANQADDRLNFWNSAGGDIVSITGDGQVGIKTTNPGSTLHVIGNEEQTDQLTDPLDETDHVVIIENSNTNTCSGFPISANCPQVLALKVNSDNPNSGINFITFFDSNGAVGAVEGNGAGGIVLDTSGADVAEWLPRLDATENIGAGDIVGVFNGRISKRTTGAMRVMVVSTAPAVLGNNPGDEKESLYEKVAFIGQVPVKVRGPVQAGDFVLPSGRNDGTGVAVSPGALRADQVGQVVGRALESASGPGLHTVKVLVGLPQTDILQTMLLQRDARLAALEARLDALERGRGWARLPGVAPWLGLGLLAGLVLARRRKEVVR